MLSFLMVGIGGCFGAMGRYGASVYIKAHYKSDFPLATLLVNITGCLVLGAIFTYLNNKTSTHFVLNPGITAGFLGALTTFSTFSYDTLVLLQSGKTSQALLSVLLNVVVGLAAVWGGQWVVNALCPMTSA